MDDRVINIFLEDGQQREYLINSNHTVERIKAVVTKDHDPTFGGTIALEDLYVGNYCLSMVSFYADHGDYTIRNLDREKDDILLYILFPSENPTRLYRKNRGSRRSTSQLPVQRVRHELLFHREGADIDLGQQKFAGMFIPRTSDRRADLVNQLTVRIAAPDKTGNLRKYSAKAKKWQKKYFLLKNGVLWYCASREDQTQRKSISLVGVDPIVRSKKYKNCFEINAPLRVYILAAESAEDTHSWLRILNMQRKDANHNNHIQLAEFFTCDYESQRTAKEHESIHTCLSSLKLLLEDRHALAFFKRFLGNLPQLRQPQRPCRVILDFYLDVTGIYRDVNQKRKAVDQIWVSFENLQRRFLQPRTGQKSGTPFSIVVLGKDLVTECIDRIAKHRSRRTKLANFNAPIDPESVPAPSITFLASLRAAVRGFTTLFYGVIANGFHGVLVFPASNWLRKS